MADLSSYSGVESELAATSDYDVTLDVDKCKRYVAAIRRKLHFASASGRDGVTIQFQHQVLSKELDKALAWLAANDAAASEAARLRNPSVLHADFSNFGPYGVDYR